MPPKTQKSARKKGKPNTNFNKKQAPKFSKNNGNKQSAKNKPAIKRQPTETARTKNQTDKQSRDSVSMPIQWFPGHMAKTRRKITESLTKVDAVCEIVDARIPNSSRNPELSDIIQKKPRIILLNKSDMADPNVTALWQKHFTAQNNIALAVDCRSGKGMKQFAPAVNKLLEKQIAANVAKGMAGKAIRLMIVGIPNVGKSSFINRLTGAKRAKVEDRPGVTRDNQWFVADEHLQLLDTPGVLWPKFEDQTVGEHLAFTGAVKDAILDIETLAVKLLAVLRKLYPELLCNRYKIEINAADSDYDLLCKIAQKRGMVVRGGEVDTERAATMLLDEYRGGVLGKITLERPEEF